MNTDQFPNLDGILQSFIKKHNIAIEKLTEEQIAGALRQALECGDFIRNVRVTDNAQCVIYIPYAREQQLEFRISRLELALKERNITDPDTVQPFPQ